MPETVTDDVLINCGFDLAFHYYLVSYCTNCVQHSSGKFVKCEFTSLHWIEIHIIIIIVNMIATISNYGKKEIINKSIVSAWQDKKHFMTREAIKLKSQNLAFFRRNLSACLYEIISSFRLYREANSGLQIIKYFSQRHRLHRFEAGSYEK